MSLMLMPSAKSKVALLAEGVDRNNLNAEVLALNRVALLAEGVDRNGIKPILPHLKLKVALLAEGVDRNLQLLLQRLNLEGRPPRGGRG